MTATTLSHYLVCNADTGHGFGLYRAANELDAIDAMMREAGCNDAPIPDLLAFPLVVTVTGRGEASAVPDRADAVDFTVTAGDASVSLTLLVDDFSGQLDVWGMPDQWCADAKQARADFGMGWEVPVVVACRDAFRAA